MRRTRVAIPFLAVALLAVVALGAPAHAQQDTPCGPAPDGYNVIISNDEMIDGTNEADFICAGGASSIIVAEGGDDIVFGGGGDDRIEGGDGDDYLLGGPGRDYIRGGGGDDRINGGANDDDLVGDWGNDVLHGRRGNDVLNGGRGNDRLRGGLGRDALLGSQGNDILYGQAGADFLWGGSERDRLDGRRGADYCLPAAVVRNCENQAPTWGGLELRFDSPGLFRGPSFDLYGGQEAPFPWRSAPLIAIWTDSTRTELLHVGLSDRIAPFDTARPHKNWIEGSGGIGGFFFIGNLGSFVVDVFDTSSRLSGSITPATTEAERFGRAHILEPGRIVRGSAPAGLAVTSEFQNTETGETVDAMTIADQSGQFLFTVPGSFGDSWIVIITVKDQDGNRTRLARWPSTAAFSTSDLEELPGWIEGIKSD